MAGSAGAGLSAGPGRDEIDASIITCVRAGRILLYPARRTPVSP
jgi:hypothetical protein